MRIIGNNHLPKRPMMVRKLSSSDPQEMYGEQHGKKKVPHQC